MKARFMDLGNRKGLFVLLPSVFVFSSMLFGGCGYTNRAVLPNNIRTIAVPPFQNEIPTQDQFTHVAGLEVDITEAVIDRLLFDGNLKVTDLKKADARLVGSIISYHQEATRFNNLEGVSEYRLYVICKLTLIDQRTDTVIWNEPAFSGDTEYYIEGANVKPEREALDRALEDFAKNVVDRIVEDW